jgi:aryl-alcohol dehydrogenase-like predicted oxidoreductase
MKTRRIGPLEVSAIGLGCMGMSIAYGARDEPGAIATVHHALDRGVTFIDTADVYGGGHNEELLSRALKGRRDQATLATKFGNTRTPEGKQVICGTPDYVAQACDASLARLKTDVIDLYYLHRVDATVPIEETVGAMAQLVQAGKVRHIGLSEAGAQTIRRAHATHPITALQSEYSLWSRDVEGDILDTCRDLGIGFVAYSPLGRGYLTGDIPTLDALIEGDRRRDHPRFTAENMARNAALLDAIRAVAEIRDVSLAQVAIAWLLARGEDVVPIPGTKKIKWLDANIAAMDVQLTAEDLAALNSAFSPGVAAGDRYPPGAMKHLSI